MKKVVAMTAFLTFLLTPTLLKNRRMHIFDANLVKLVVEYKSSALKMRRQAYEEKAEMYLRILRKSLLLADKAIGEEKRQEILANADRDQHLGFLYWIISNTDRDMFQFYLRHLTARNI